MHMRTRLIGPLFVTSFLFGSCTCHQQVPPIESPAPLAERPSGFHASQPGRTAPMVAQAETPTAAHPTPSLQVAAATPNATPPAEIPADFPKDVPIFKDASVTHVQSLANNAHNVIFSTSAPVQDVSSFYEDKMTQAGWKVTQRFARKEHAFLSVQKGNLIANITVAEDAAHPGQQVLAIMYEEQQALPFDEF